MLATPASERIQHAIVGSASLFDARRGQSILKGVVLADTPEEMALSWAATVIAEWNRDGKHPVDITANPTPEQRADVEGALKTGWKLRASAVAFQNDWITYGPSFTPLFVAATNDDAAAPLNSQQLERNRFVNRVLAHEMEHVVTFPSWSQTLKPSLTDLTLAQLANKSLFAYLAGQQPVRWMEEGGTDLLTVWTGNSDRIAAATGLRAAGPERNNYEAERMGMTRLLELAGIDTDRAVDRAAAEELLQGGTLEQEPRRIAERIVAQKKIDAAHLDELTDRIVRTAPVSPYIVAVLPKKLHGPADALINTITARRFDRFERYVNALAAGTVAEARALAVEADRASASEDQAFERQFPAPRA